MTEKEIKRVEVGVMPGAAGAVMPAGAPLGAGRPAGEPARCWPTRICQ